MQTNYWLERWANNHIRFHQDEFNPLLIKYFEQLSLSGNSRIFVPLCGKSLDMAWLLSQGHQVVGIELSPIAIKQLFEQLSITPQITNIENLRCYQADNITLFEGDFFALSKQMLGEVDAIYDRAALVALPEEIRHRYTNHLTTITNRTPQLLITHCYAQDDKIGPPFSVSEDEVKKHYASNYCIKHLTTLISPSKHSKDGKAKENAWLLY